MQNLEINPFSRRTLFKGTALTCLASSAPLAKFIPNAYASSSSSLLGFPKTISSKDGVLETTLTAQAGMRKTAGVNRWVMSYNNLLPGPVLIAKPGDTLKIKLENKLNIPTNLHVHGLHVSPLGNSDNPFITVAAGKSFDYEIKILKNQNSGIFWYHPHHHGMVAAEEASGLYGMILIQDAIDQRPAFSGSDQLLLTLAAPVFGKDSSITKVSAAELAHGRSGNNVLINDQLLPTFKVNQQRPTRIALLNADPSQLLTLKLSSGVFRVIATAGGRLDNSYTSNILAINSGDRYEFLIENAKSGLVTLFQDKHTIAYFDNGGAKNNDFSKQIAPTISKISTSKSRKITIEGHGQVAVAANSEDSGSMAGMDMSNNSMPGMDMSGSGAMMVHQKTFTFNGASFNPQKVNELVKFGDSEEWVIENKSTMEHPFHLHTWPFQIKDDGTGKALPGWRDVVTIPAHSTARIAIKFADFSGATVYHCHILDHEDQGMMGIVKVV